MARWSFLVIRQGLQLLGALQPERHATLEGLRWCAVTLEVSFASVATLISLRIQGAAWAATSPITMCYPLVLVAASFRLRPAISIYAAVLATAQWLLVYYVGIEPRLPADLAARLPTLQAWAAWERAFWILGAGSLLAIAAHRLRALVSANLRQSHLRWNAVHELERLVSPDVASRATSPCCSAICATSPRCASTAAPRRRCRSSTPSTRRPAR